MDGDERAGWKTATACCLHCLDEQTAAVEAREWQQIEQAHGDCKGNAERLFGRRYQPGTNAAPVSIRLAAPAERDAIRTGVFICFESAFSRYVQDLVAGGAQLLVNLSDDSWFGDSAEPEEHLAHAVFRAIESRRDLIRATGSGISAHITATGQVERSLPLSHSDDSVAVLVAKTRLLQGRSFYQWIGDGFPLACVVLIVASLVVSRRRWTQGGRGSPLRRSRLVPP